MENKVKVSIVLPVYNVEAYLERCLDSLINQTEEEIEIIAINDGSNDNSLKILDNYIDKDKRIQIINMENKGVSYCRNLGVKKSKGKYIMFVDSDDWIEKDTIEKMYKESEKNNSDITMCTYIREFSNHSKEKKFNLPELKIYKEDEIKDDLLRKLVGPVKEELSNPEYLDALGTIWAKLYKSSLIQDNNIEFVDLKEIGSAEDTLFNIYAFKYAKKVVFINKPKYHYWRDNPKSITSIYNPNLKNQRKKFFNYINNFIKENNLSNEFNEGLNNRICTSVLGLGLIEVCKDNKISHLQKMKNIKGILSEEYIRDGYKNLDLKYFSLHWKLFYFFNKYKVAFGSYLMLVTIEFLRTKKI